MDDPAAESANAAASTPAPAKIQPDNEIIQEWLRKRYYGLEHYGHTSAISIEDFLQIASTVAKNRGRSWLTEDQVEVPLILLTRNREAESRVLILPTAASTQLCAIGAGVAEEDAFSKNFSSFLDLMKGEDRPRWIVVPVSDGVLGNLELRKETSAAESGGAKETTLESEMTTPGKGCHWGLMVIHTDNRDARWIDGHLIIRRKTTGNKRWYIHHMFDAGWAAGKVLKGYERVMDLGVGQFQASTLKWVPHDYRNNNYRGDGGSACGPYAFAMLDYFFGNQGYLDDLKGTFTIGKQQKHIRELGFNSEKTRDNMQQIIWERAEEIRNIERKEAEKKKKERKAVERSDKEEKERKRIKELKLPCKLTKEILNINLSSRGIWYLQTYWDMTKKSVAKSSKKNPKKGSGKGGGNGGGGNGGGGGSGHGGHGGHGRLEASLSPEILQILDAIIEKEPDTFKDCPNKSAQREIAYQQYLDAQDLARVEESKRAGNNPNNGLDDGSDNTPRQNSKQVDFLRMSTSELIEFIEQNPFGDSFKTKTPAWNHRAILTQIHGGFDKLSEDDIAEWRLNDPRFVGRRNLPHQRVIQELKHSVSKVLDRKLQGSTSQNDAEVANQITTQHDGQTGDQTKTPDPGKVVRNEDYLDPSNVDGDTPIPGANDEEEEEEDEEPVQRPGQSGRKRKAGSLPSHKSPKKAKEVQFDITESQSGAISSFRSDLTVEDNTLNSDPSGQSQERAQRQVQALVQAEAEAQTLARGQRQGRTRGQRQTQVQSQDQNEGQVQRQPSGSPPPYSQFEEQQ